MKLGDRNMSVIQKINLENQFFYGERVGTYGIDDEEKLILFDLPTYSARPDQSLALILRIVSV